MSKSKTPEVVDITSDDEVEQPRARATVNTNGRRRETGSKARRSDDVLDDPPEVKFKRIKIEEDPPGPNVPDVIPASIKSLPPNDRLKYIKTFWEQRRNRMYFPLRKIKNLKRRAVEAVELFLKAQGKTPQVKYERTFKGDVVCMYVLEQDKFIAGKALSNDEATSIAAVECLKTFMTPLEFYHVDFISSEEFTNGITGEILEKTLDEIPSHKPFLSEMEQILNKSISQWTFTKYNLLSQDEKETVIVNFWTPFFTPNRSNSFPRIRKLMGQTDFETKLEVLRSLFSAKDTAEGTFFEGISYDAASYVGTIKWTVKGQVFQESASGSRREDADTVLARKALEVILGSQLYRSVARMNERFIWKEISHQRIHNLIQEKLESVPVEGAADMLEEYFFSRGEPAPVFSFSDAFHVKCKVRKKEFDALYTMEKDAKNMAAFQALEHLWGTKIEIE